MTASGKNCIWHLLNSALRNLAAYDGLAVTCILVLLNIVQK